MRTIAPFVPLLLAAALACDDSAGPQGETGDLRVASSPTGAAVTVNGVRTGMKTPAVIDKIPAGEFVVRVRLDGYVADPESLIVMVGGESTATASFTLQEPVDEPDVQRIVLIEHFTSASCTGCPAAHAAIGALVEELGYEKVITVSDHMNWPIPYQDPFFLANPAQLTERLGLFGVRSLPYSWVDGAALGNPDNLYETMLAAVEEALQVEPSFDLRDLVAAVDGDSFVVTGTVEKLAETVEGDEALVVMVIETDIDFNAMNGVDHFDDVVRWFLPGADGEALVLTVGESRDFRYAVFISEAWEGENLQAVACVESHSTRKVYQTVHTR
ncbi:MAG: PEGA domain-containing protein [Candidatus Eisenbacteria bacterium]|nr:PEGA domain-containing protein [Candidatus Eisenbacteria bacterium]